MGNLNRKSMLIVGAGIAGLSTGCYALANGYRATIVEMHAIPGGLCTAWKRKGYTFDISMHMVVGSKSGPFHTMWEELGVLKRREFVYHDESVVIESGGKRLSIGADPRRLEEQMRALSPADAEVTKAFIRLIFGKSITALASLKPVELWGVADKLNMAKAIVPFLSTIRKYGRMTIQEFAQRFEDPFLRNAVRFFVDSPGWPMLRYPMTALAGFARTVRESGVPIGGSQKVVLEMAEHFLERGGRIRYGKPATEVIIENGRAVGVRVKDGTEYRADVIVWAADGHTLIFYILGGRYVNDQIRRMYREWVPVLPLVHVAVGVARDMSKEPHRLVFEVEKPITVAGEDHHWLCALHHSFDPTMAPQGKSAVEVWYATRYDYWESLATDRVRYEAEKKRIAELTIAALDKRWPHFASQVEVVDVPTPVTYVRYTGNWQASPDGWYITPDNMSKRTLLRTLPGLSGLYMVGQWTAPFAGTVLSALTGRQLIELLCKQERRFFASGV